VTDVEGWIAAGLAAHGAPISMDQVRTEIEADRARLWVGEGCAAVAGFQVPLGVLEYHIWVGGGDLAGLKALEQQITDYAVANRCARVIVHGRRGWLRALPGYSPAAMYTKELP